MTEDAVAESGSREPVMRVEGITKSFGAVKVLRGVDLHLEAGEVLGVVGANGAGKSTLVKIITGYEVPDGGQMYLDGKPVQLRSVQDARSHGIETVFQDLALVDQLSVYHNLFLNREMTTGGRLRFLNNRRMRDDARRYLHDIQVDIPSVDVPVEKLSGGQRQAIAVARATRRDDVKILLLDEPLAAMGAREAKLIIDLVQSLAKKRGVSMVVIDHNYTHIFELCDRVNVVEQGRVVLDKRTKDTSLAELTEFMVSSYRQQIEEDSA
ncbi:ATP-binding cassette domain-containing protein [Leekyejoonella antrihumi]|uniref:ATP-binding cassette domain-containing protein n=1 Tax=Leekyejoonella antrihumi TaxID=1660198 RepID=UPI0016492463|nr:ATP-binding cassette domain-containing protein [Leekyejoonella antrihumi]